MRIEPELDEVVYGQRGMLRSIEVLLEAQCLVASVALIFSTIDAVSALSRPVGQPETEKSVFISWVNKYVKPRGSIGCSAQDLYAARCGVLHSYSADSRLGRQGQVRRLIYEWEQGPSADDSTPLPDNAVVLSVERLHGSMIDAIRRYMVDTETDATTRERMLHHLPAMLCYKPWNRLEAVVAA